MATGPEHDLAVAESEADLALRHDGVLILAGVQVRRNQRADREGMLVARRVVRGIPRGSKCAA
jgi:hypothetical protein